MCACTVPSSFPATEDRSAFDLAVAAVGCQCRSPSDEKKLYPAAVPRGDMHATFLLYSGTSCALMVGSEGICSNRHFLVAACHYSSQFLCTWRPDTLSSFHRTLTIGLSFRYQHCLLSPLSLTLFAFHCTDLHWQRIARGHASSVYTVDLVSAFCRRIYPARMHGGALPQCGVLRAPRHQLVSALVLWIDACSLLESRALVVEQLVELGLAQAIDDLQLSQRTLRCQTRSRLQLQGRASPVLHALTISDVAKDAQRSPCVARHEEEVLATTQVFVRDGSFRRR